MMIKPNNEQEFHELICNFIDERNAKRQYVTDLDFIKTSINEKGYQLLYAPLCQRSEERICNLVLAMCQDSGNELIKNSQLAEWINIIKYAISNLEEFDGEKQVVINFIGYLSDVSCLVETYYKYIDVMEEAKKLNLTELKVSEVGCCYPIKPMYHYFLDMYNVIPPEDIENRYDIISQVSEHSSIQTSIKEGFLSGLVQTNNAELLSEDIRMRYELVSRTTYNNELVELRLVKHKVDEKEPFDPSHNIGIGFLLHRLLGENWYIQNREDDLQALKSKDNLLKVIGVTYYYLKTIKKEIKSKEIAFFLAMLGISDQDVDINNYRNSTIYTYISKKKFNNNITLPYIKELFDKYGLESSELDKDSLTYRKKDKL